MYKRQHATIGVVLTTDGSIAGIPRENYIAAEERVISELKQIGKPFVVVLNSASPHGLEAQALKNQLSEKYGVSVVLMDVLNMERDDVNQMCIRDRLEDMRIEVEVEDNSGIGIEIAGMSSEINMGEMFAGILPQKTKTRKVSIREARKILEAEAADELIDMDEVIETAVARAEQFRCV